MPYDTLPIPTPIHYSSLYTYMYICMYVVYLHMHRMFVCMFVYVFSSRFWSGFSYMYYYMFDVMWLWTCLSCICSIHKHHFHRPPQRIGKERINRVNTRRYKAQIRMNAIIFKEKYKYTTSALIWALNLQHTVIPVCRYLHMYIGALPTCLHRNVCVQNIQVKLRTVHTMCNNHYWTTFSYRLYTHFRTGYTHNVNVHVHVHVYEQTQAHMNKIADPYFTLWWSHITGLTQPLAATQRTL